MGANKQFRKSLALGLMLGGLSLSCHADLYEDGLIAYASGEHALAGSYFIDAAEHGNVGAEHMLTRRPGDVNEVLVAGEVERAEAELAIALGVWIS